MGEGEGEVEGSGREVEREIERGEGATKVNNVGENDSSAKYLSTMTGEAAQHCNLLLH